MVGGSRASLISKEPRVLLRWRDNGLDSSNVCRWPDQSSVTANLITTTTRERGSLWEKEKDTEGSVTHSHQLSVSVGLEHAPEGNGDNRCILKGERLVWPYSGLFILLILWPGISTRQGRQGQTELAFERADITA